MKKTALCVVMLASLFTACKKDDKKDTSGSGTAEGKTITTHGWSITSWKLTMEGSPEMDASSLLPACYLDNIFWFKSDGNCIADEGPTKCDSRLPGTYAAGQWELKGGGKQIYLKGFRTTAGVSDITADIVTLNETTMVLKYLAAPAIPGAIPTMNTTTYKAVK
jgi:hypothetical protein